MQKAVIVCVLGCLVFGNGDTNSTRYRRQSNEERCTGPPYPKHGSWSQLMGESKPGDKIAESSVIRFECDPGYKLSTYTPYLVCDENWDSQPIPECEGLCPPLYSSSTFNLTCIDKRGKEIKCSAPTHGTYVEYTCARFYETAFGSKKTLLCEDGKWNQKPLCQPVCGKKVSDTAITLIYGSKPNDKLEYPWVTAVYKKMDGQYKNICGGSILSETIVLTAAHCVTNDAGDIYPKEDYVVGAGKLYNKYLAPEDTHAQYREISEIIVHDDYKGDIRHFLADIAVLVVKGEFTLNEVIQPVCFNNLKSIHLHPRSMGEISGWGLAEGDLPSEVLRTLKIPYKYETTCALELPPNFGDRYNTIDKICAGYVNRSTAVCKGDSGSGLAFQNPEDNRYYLHGVVSLGPLGNVTCNIQQNSLYTKVAFYYEYIDRLITRYAPEVSDCILPKGPKNGNYTTNKPGKKPGDAVPSSTILTFHCNRGYKLSSSNPLQCDSAYNMPTCQLLCPMLNFPKETYYRCADKEGHPIDCSDAVDGATMSFSCPRGYEEPADSSNVRTCTKGSWGAHKAECLRPPKNCGKKGIASSETNSNATIEGLEYPWAVGLYRFSKTLQGFYYKCGASLISNKVVITAANCVSDKNGVHSKKDYTVAAGKFYNTYNDSRDEHAQYSNISFIIVHPRYKISSKNFSDIGLLLVEKPFTLNNFVQPICFNDVDSIPLQPGDKGVMSGFVFNLTTSRFQAIETSYVGKGICWKEETLNLNYFDKICAEFFNTSRYLHGAAGKGLAVKNPEDGRYYIHGVFSYTTSRVEEKQQNILFTSVATYYDFIDCVISKFA